MPDHERITIRITQPVTHKDGSPPWHVGLKLHTTHDELKQRGVPNTHYTVVAPPEAKTAPGPRKSDTPGTKTK